MTLGPLAPIGRQIGKAKPLIYPGAPQSLTDTHKGAFNADLLALIQGQFAGLLPIVFTALLIDGSGRIARGADLAGRRWLFNSLGRSRHEY